MKEGDTDQKAHLHRAVFGLGNRQAGAHEIAVRRKRGGRHRGHRIAMGAKRPLGVAGGARGIEDRGIVFRLEQDRGHRPVGKIAPGVAGADHRLERRQLRALKRLWAARDIDALELGALRQDRCDPLEAFGIDDGNACAAVTQGVFELGAGPPGIERHGDRTHQPGGKEAHRPLGQVAHRDHHAIALAHAVGLQGMRHGEGGAGELLEADPLVFIDEKNFFSVHAAGQKDLAHGGRRVFPDRLLATGDRDLGGLIGRAGRGHGRMRLLDAHRRPAHLSSPSCSPADRHESPSRPDIPAARVRAS